MNNRDYKEFAENTAYHIYNRGTGKMRIFLDQEDYYFFLHRLGEALYPETCSPILNKRQYIPKLLPVGAFDLFSYCLMPNHFHLNLFQNTDLPVSAFVSKVCTSYGKYFNKKYERVGTVFQDQFKAVAVKSNEQLLYLSCYIHQNPLKAGMVKNLTEYPYSSFLDYAGMREGKLCKKNFILDQFKGDTKAYLQVVMNMKEFDILSELLIDDD